MNIVRLLLLTFCLLACVQTIQQAVQAATSATASVVSAGASASAVAASTTTLVAALGAPLQQNLRQLNAARLPANTLIVGSKEIPKPLSTSHATAPSPCVRLFEDLDSPLPPLASGSLECLRAYLGNNLAQFEPAQEALLRAVQHRRHVIGVISTGRGKTAVFAVEALRMVKLAEKQARPADLTIVVVPLVALRVTMAAALRAGGLGVCEWTRTNSVTRQAESTVTHSDQIVLVVTETAASAVFLAAMQNVALGRKIARVVIDETHMVLIDSTWRYHLLLTRQLAVLGSPLLLLSATIPPTMLDQIASSFDLDRFTLVRAPTVPTTLDLAIEHVDWRSRHNRILELVLQVVQLNSGFRNGPLRQVLVFTDGTRQADELAQLINSTRSLTAASFHSRLNLDKAQGIKYADLDVVLSDAVEGGGTDNQARADALYRLYQKQEAMRASQKHTLERFQSGKLEVLIATKALEAGVDLKNVDLVIFANASSGFAQNSTRPWSSLVTYRQQLGRAGRRGQRAKVMFLVSESPLPPDHIKDTAHQALVDFLHDLTMCKQLQLSIFFDGPDLVKSCEPEHQCSACMRLATLPPSSNNAVVLAKDYQRNLVASPADHHRRRVGVTLALLSFLGPLTVDERQRPEYRATVHYSIRSVPCAYCWLAALCHRIGSKKSPEVRATRPFDCAPFLTPYAMPPPINEDPAASLHTVETCPTFKANADAASDGQGSCRRCFNGGHNVSNCGLPSLASCLAGNNIRSHCYVCGLRHASYGYNLQPHDDFLTPGACGSQVSDFFWTFSITLCIWLGTQ